MSTQRYLVDNNALSQLTTKQRTSHFFRGHCRLPSDVLFEARGYAEPQLADLEYLVTPEVLEHLIVVTASLRPGDTDLVDLYANKGTADPILVACAVGARELEVGILFHDSWIIVTDDKGLSATARQFDVEVLSSSDFQAMFSG